MKNGLKYDFPARCSFFFGILAESNYFTLGRNTGACG